MHFNSVAAMCYVNSLKLSQADYGVLLLASWHPPDVIITTIQSDYGSSLIIFLLSIHTCTYWHKCTFWERFHKSLSFQFTYFHSIVTVCSVFAVSMLLYVCGSSPCFFHIWIIFCAMNLKQSLLYAKLVNHRVLGHGFKPIQVWRVFSCYILPCHHCNCFVLFNIVFCCYYYYYYYCYY